MLSTDMIGDRMADVTIESPALGGKVAVRLLLPPSFGDRPDQRWPVLYLLHGCCDTYQSWTRSTDVEELSARFGVLVAMPAGGDVGFYSDWIDGPQWERFHTKELPAILESHFNAAGDRAAIGGVSMGGLGALGYAARHPGQYTAAASFSGITHPRLNPGGYTGLVGSFGHEMADLWGNSSDSDAWLGHDPYHLADLLEGADLFISVGNGDPGPLDPPATEADPIEAGLHRENLSLRHRLRELDIAAEFDFYGAGTHSWPYWQRELHRSWPLIISALDPPPR